MFLNRSVLGIVGALLALYGAYSWYVVLWLLAARLSQSMIVRTSLLSGLLTILSLAALPAGLYLICRALRLGGEGQGSGAAQTDP